MTFWSWSKTAADNDDADSTINAREGMAPSLVNNGMRAMMAAIAKWRDDTSGLLETGGSASAYTITTNQVYSSLIDGMKVAFRAHATNTAAPTLNVDGQGAKPLRMYTGAALLAGKILIGSAYIAVYRSNTDEWLLLMAAGFYEIPSGTKMLFAQASAPAGWTKDTTHNDKALRVVSGTPGSGGSTAFSTVFAADRTPGGTVDGTALTEAQLPAHRHLVVVNVSSEATDPVTSSESIQITGGGGSSNARYTLIGDGQEPTRGRTSEAGSGEEHAHDFTGDAMDFAVAYVDVMIATKA
jgi:hypothetical protein